MFKGHFRVGSVKSGEGTGNFSRLLYQKGLSLRVITNSPILIGFDYHHFVHCLNIPKLFVPAMLLDSVASKPKLVQIPQDDSTASLILSG